MHHSNKFFPEIYQQGCWWQAKKKKREREVQFSRIFNEQIPLPFFEDLKSSNQSFQTKEIISIGRDVNFIKNNIGGPLCLFITLFLTYNFLLRSLEQAPKTKQNKYKLFWTSSCQYYKLHYTCPFLQQNITIYTTK